VLREMTALLNTLCDVRKATRRVRRESPEHYERVLSDYNEALASHSEAARARFRENYSPVAVIPEQSPEIAKGAFRGASYKPKLIPSEVGTLLVLQGETEDWLLLPDFDVTWNRPTIMIAYEIAEDTSETGSKGRVVKVSKPAMCHQLDNRTWELIREGELQGSFRE